MSSPKNLANRIFLLSRLLLGFVFVASGILKLISPEQASNLLSQMSSFDVAISKVLILLGSVIELLLGVAFMVGGRYLRLASVVSSTALLAFTFVGLWALQNPIPCGCFGDIFEFKTDEYLVARNIALLLASMLVLHNSNETTSRPQKESYEEAN